MDEMRDEFQTVMELAAVLTRQAIEAEAAEEKDKLLKVLLKIFEKRAGL